MLLSKDFVNLTGIDICIPCENNAAVFFYAKENPLIVNYRKIDGSGKNDGFFDFVPTDTFMEELDKNINYIVDPEVAVALSSLTDLSFEEKERAYNIFTVLKQDIVDDVFYGSGIVVYSRLVRVG